ncbi:TetR/AcrR family transcriptional regulator [Vibrio sp. Isolate30]|uniref:TetR/AcrR family transcriptional regulator n=1 Tax=Vibrio sp. Isolate30 TaxID=2908536 RepID=UPI001EFE6FC4|nr:TetR/AcrR family transcriptional regulator [Vibrio sp. Isolate30]MCG9629575.1 TetR/AcrR family transcriptional regulator [Vibrio sp. Isolate30]
MSVKDQKRGRPKVGDRQLSAEGILATAKVMMREGGKIPSIRALATQLGVDAMAIYHYFKNKSELLEAITVSLMQEIVEPDEQLDWKDNIYRLSTSYLTILNDHPGLLETLLTMKSLSPVEVFSQRFEASIASLNLSEEQRNTGRDLLVDYLHGYALALNCNPDRTELTAEMIEKPIELYYLALLALNK